MKRKHSIIVTVALCAVVVVAAVLIPLRKNQKSSLPAPTLPVRGDAETITYEFSDDFSLSAQETAPLYQIQVPTAEELIQQVEETLGVTNLADYFSTDAGESGSIYYVDELYATVTVNPHNGFWSFTTEDPNAPIVPENLPDDNTAVQLAEEYIKQHNLFSGDLGAPTVTHSYTGGDANDPDCYMDVTVTYYPQIDGQEVYGLYRISVSLGENASVIKLFKQADPAVVSQQVSLKSKETVMQEVLADPNRVMSTATDMDKGVLTDCTLKYYLDGVDNNGSSYAYPVYVLTGLPDAAVQSDSEASSFEVVIDAIKRDLKKTVAFSLNLCYNI